MFSFETAILTLVFIFPFASEVSLIFLSLLACLTNLSMETPYSKEAPSFSARQMAKLPPAAFLLIMTPRAWTEADARQLGM